MQEIDTNKTSSVGLTNLYNGKFLDFPAQNIPAKRLFSIDLSPDKKTLVVGSEDGKIFLFDVMTELFIDSVHIHESAVEKVRFLDDNNIVVATESGDLSTWSKNGLKMNQIINAHDKTIYSVLIDKANAKIITGAMDKHVKVWNLKDLSKEMELHSPSRGVISLLKTRIDGKDVLLSGNVDGTLNCWTIDDYELVFSKKLMSGPMFSLSPSCEENKILCAGEGSTILLFDLKNEKIVNSIHTSQRRVMSLMMMKTLWSLTSNESAADYLLFSGGGDGSIKILYRDVVLDRFQELSSLKIHNRTVEEITPLFEPESFISVSSEATVGKWSSNLMKY
ncbi:MAG: hypothetical protein ACTSVI_11290 [Promethearchaeota archaeon]